MAVLVRRNLPVGRRLGDLGVASRSLRRRLVWPAVTFAVMFALTIGLGVWQLQRLQWKLGILAQIDRGESEPPVPLTGEPEPFRRVVATGQFGPQVGRYGAEVRSTAEGEAMGSQVLSPLTRPGQAPLIVDRGWAPDGVPSPPPSGTVSVEGYIHPSEHPFLFGIHDDPAAKRFVSLDPAAIGLAFGLQHVAPFALVALGPPGVIPERALHLPRPPNDHLSYAITWFGLAAALSVIFAVYVRQAIRQQERP